MYDKCYFCLDQLPKLKKESTASFFVNFGGAGVQKSRPTLLLCLLKNSVVKSRLAPGSPSCLSYVACHYTDINLYTRKRM